MKFRRKPEIVDAVQFTQAMAEGKESLPPGVWEHGAGEFKVDCLGVTVLLDVSDWIVSSEDEYAVFTAPEFAADYEPIEETTR